MPFSKPVPKTKFCSKEVGERAEAFIVAKLMECGYIVLIPFGNSQRYDLVIEDNDCHFWRIQCKSGRYRGGAIIFDTSLVMNEYRRNWERKSYRGEVDFFAVYSKDFGKVYLVPIDEVGDNRRASLRVDQPNRGYCLIPDGLGTTSSKK
jgi:hypothetical protein